MTTVGLKELRQDASGVVRRVENGEQITVTVAGRPSVRMVPVDPARWRAWSDFEELFCGPPDPDWHRQRDLIDGAIYDPWQRA